MNLFDMAVPPAPEQRRERTVETPAKCCAEVIARYEAIGDIATTAKTRGGVNLFCAVCHARIAWQDNEWKRYSI